jgi:hypothetical protein
MMDTIRNVLQPILDFRYHGYPVGIGGSALLALLLLARLFQPRPKKGGTARSHRNLHKIHPHLDPAVRRKLASKVTPLPRPLPPQASPETASSDSSLAVAAPAETRSDASARASGREW